MLRRRELERSNKKEAAPIPRGYWNGKGALCQDDTECSAEGSWAGAGPAAEGSIGTCARPGRDSVPALGQAPGSAVPLCPGWPMAAAHCSPGWSRSFQSLLCSRDSCWRRAGLQQPGDSSGGSAEPSAHGMELCPCQGDPSPDCEL